MGKRSKHHYVPKFYLKQFKSAPRRIHLYNIPRATVFQDVSLSDQCYKQKLYGNDDVEGRLAFLESAIAPVLRDIVSRDVLPKVGTDDYRAILAIVGLQALRTARLATIADQRIDKLMKQLHSRDPRMRNDVEFVHDVPALVHLRLLPEVLDCMEDLRAHLVVSPYQDVFLTSDNPAFRYNQLYEGVQHMGTTGFAVTGLQIFLPLSPRHQLVVYDGTTYKLRWRDRILGVTIATSTDVDTFNGIQLVAADANVYFSDGDQIEDIQRLLPRYRTLRNSDPTVVVEYGQDDDTNSSLVHTYDVTPNLELKLTFLKAKRTASHNGRFKRRGSARDQGSIRWPTHSDVFSVSRAPVKEGG